MSGMFDENLNFENLSRMKWEAEIARTSNKDLLCFGTADMDFKCAQPILDAITSVAQSGHLGYPFIRDSFYEAIIKWLKRIGNWDIRKEWISTHVGIYPSSWAIIEALTEKGDEVIFQTPVHFCFDAIVRNNGRVPIHCPLINNCGHYEMDFDALEKQISKRTKIFWLCNPHNPVGRAWSKEELIKLGNICIKHNVKIMSDDVYCDLLHEGSTYTPIATISKDISMNTISCYSISKSYNTTAVKQSVVVCENSDLLALYTLSLEKQNLNYGKNIFGLAVTEAALNECDEWITELMKYVKGNHALLKERLEDSIPGVSVLNAETTYFAWVDFRALNLSKDEFAKFFEEKASIIIEAGHKFGEAGNGFFRMNLACKRSTLEKGIDRIINAVKLLK